jgi:hypothetical protein
MPENRIIVPLEESSAPAILHKTINPSPKSPKTLLSARLLNALPLPSVLFPGADAFPSPIASSANASLSYGCIGVGHVPHEAAHLSQGTVRLQEAAKLA